jgi:hypothetical protein
MVGSALHAQPWQDPSTQATHEREGAGRPAAQVGPVPSPTTPKEVTPSIPALRDRGGTPTSAPPNSQLRALKEGHHARHLCLADRQPHRRPRSPVHPWRYPGRQLPAGRVKDGEGWKDGETSFFRVNVWRDLAAHTTDSLSKGDRVIVLGRLKARSWETPEGERRSVVEVEAEELGPSLKWATATPQRTRKAGNDRSRSGQFNDDPPF